MGWLTAWRSAAPPDDRAAEDRRLVRAIVRHGSSEAADRLVRAYFDDVHRFVTRVTGDRDCALDLTQETMIAALHAMASYDPAKASMRTWLFAIASHKAIDAHRARRAAVTSLEGLAERGRSDTTHGGRGGHGGGVMSGNGGRSGDAWETAETADRTVGAGRPLSRDPAQAQADADLLARIEAYVARFDAGTQEVFHLRTAAGLTFPQIAAARGEREEAVKARYYRLIGTIRKEFGDEWGL